MLKVNSWGSSSQGNCTRITFDDSFQLVIDAGVKGCGPIECDQVVYTHKHADHTQSSFRIHESGVEEKADIQKFHVEHTNVDGTDADCNALVIKYNGLTILWATDFSYLPCWTDLLKFHYDYIFIESNWDYEKNNGGVFDGQGLDATTIAYLKRSMGTGGHCSNFLCKEIVDFLAQKDKPFVCLLHKSQAHGSDIMDDIFKKDKNIRGYQRFTPIGPMTLWFNDKGKLEAKLDSIL